MSLDYLPSDSVSVAITAFPVQSTVPTGAHFSQSVLFFPAHAVFTFNSATASARLAFTGAALPGLYNLSAVVTGNASAEYRVVFTGGASFLVSSNYSQPQPPRMLEARFNNDGTFIGILFDSPTDQGGVIGADPFACGRFFRVTGRGGSFPCQWAADSMSVRLNPSSNAIIDIGDKVNLLANTLKAACTGSAVSCLTWDYVRGAQLPILPPKDAVVPVVIMVAPSAIGERPPLNYRYTVSSSRCFLRMQAFVTRWCWT